MGQTSALITGVPLREIADRTTIVQGFSEGVSEAFSTRTLTPALLSSRIALGAAGAWKPGAIWLMGDFPPLFSTGSTMRRAQFSSTLKYKPGPPLLSVVHSLEIDVNFGGYNHRRLLDS
jgi:hypothetical protein